ncbi:MAG: DUF4156 domain-containing protein [Curvibacter sp.]|jgi:PBP1b-binding outer membrane lipoprotein LpoB
MSKNIMFVVVAASALLLSGCASKLIGERIGADQVVLAQESQVAKCKLLGRTTFSVLANIGPIARSSEAVEDNLLQMARNDAIDKGGDTVVRGPMPAYGQRIYDIYKCK